ncbi:multidrug transporter [Endozoicomonas montiporae]|uniref:Multidrug export protein MepA n=2 Tax=Endozoicomonas montiporae TaxID=1027273 RepID=A0A081N0R3_9GAMM|nr:MATE family efflux transporter [Endozoicomonas montiporae]AMO54517.1 MATE efflux family protein [Endozoicomonas montiporae CL-33]KEQ12036.1 multidrug transporter [Endozoicomonas montiporae]
MSTSKEQKKLPSINRQFWNYVLPTVGAMLVSGLYQVIDGVFIGRYIGAEGLAGINLSWPVIGTLYGLGMMVGVGSGAISSMARGEKKLLRARRALGNGLTLLILFGLLGSLLLSLTGQWLLQLQDASGPAFEHASNYLWVLLFGTPLAMGSMALPFMVRNDDAPTIATWLIVVGAIANIILNAIFIIYLEMGLTGAALGTTLSQLLVVIFGVMYFFSARANTRLTLKDMLPEYQLSLHTCSIGLSSLLMYSYFSFITAIHNYLFMKYSDAVNVGAFAVIGYIATLYYMFAEGVAAGAQPLISYNYGAGRYARMKQFVNRMLWVAIGSGILSVIVVNIFADPIIRVFNTEDPVFFDAAKLGLRLHLAGMFLDGLIFSAGVFFQSLGLGRKATFVTMANMLIQLPFLLVLPMFLDIKGIWLAVPLSNIALSLIVLVMMGAEWKKLGLSRHSKTINLSSSNQQHHTA